MKQKTKRLHGFSYTPKPRFSKPLFNKPLFSKYLDLVNKLQLPSYIFNYIHHLDLVFSKQKGPDRLEVIIYSLCGAYY